MSQRGKSNHYNEYLLKHLKRYELFVYAISADGLSVYIHFRNLPNGATHKLRISNHNERSRYGYKWQLRWDVLSNIEQKPYSRYFDNPDDLIADFKRYYTVVAQVTHTIGNGRLLTLLGETK